jgi:hypothetical protein
MDAPASEAREPAPSAQPPSAQPPSPPPPPAFPEGWAGPAMAIQAVRQIPRPILVSLVPAELPPIVIDLRYLTYDWDAPITAFPADPGTVQVGTHYLDEDPRELSARATGVDPLLWLIGIHAFPGVRASWLRPGDRYKLKWWPDLDVMRHTPEQARVVRTLAGGLMTVEKLAQKAKVDEAVAHDVVNALSLMAALRRIDGPGGAPMLPPMSAEFQPVVKIGRHSTRRGG